MLKGVKRFIVAQEIHPWRHKISANQPTINLFRNSAASFSSSSSRNFYIRKRRKWPIQPHKKQLPDFLAFQLAKKSFKKSIKKSKSHNLLPDLINACAAYEVEPSPQSYHFLFKILIQNCPANYRDQILQVLDHIEKFESFETPECVFVDLIKFYGENGMFDDAVELFSTTPRFRCEPSVETLNALLSVLCKNEKGLEIVPKLLVKSQSMSIRIEESTFEILIRALCGIGDSSNALALLNQMVEEGFDLNQKVCSLMLATMCRQLNYGGGGGDGGGILGFLDDLKNIGFKPRINDFVNVIRVLVKRGEGMDALGLLKRMKIDKIRANVICYNLVLDWLICNKEFQVADKVFDEMLVLGLVPDKHTYNVYINGLCLQGKLEEGMAMFHSMEELGCVPDLKTYSVVSSTLYGAGELRRVRDMVQEMRLKCTRLGLDQRMLEILIDSFVIDGYVEGACSLVDEFLDDENHIHHSKGLDKIVCRLWKAGLRCKAEELLEKMAVEDLATGVRGAG
uniref:Pentatricopeptide repeat protein n=1 Tax=Salvia miltiorrhiza TaxID=226208 RepID=A0A678WFH2_SALMI|nr:pentatricopeptide repeat protein [Salvia miltiorrhiza]